MAAMRLSEKGLERSINGELRRVPVNELRDELSSGQTRLSDINTALNQHERDAIRKAFMQLLEQGEIEVFPVGEQVTVRLVGEAGPRRGPG